VTSLAPYYSYIKFPRLACDLRGKRESMLFSVVKGILVAAMLHARKVTPDEGLAEAPIDIVDFDIEQVGLP
jgi:hypothetical protein